MSKVKYEKVNLLEGTPAMVQYISQDLLKNMKNVPLNLDMIPEHWHRSIELSLVVKGSVNLYINQHQETISAGEFIFVNSGQIHKLDSDDIHSCEVMLVIISYEFLKKRCPNIDELYFDIHKSEKKERLREIYECLRMYSTSNEKYKELMIDAYIYEILYILLTTFQQELPQAEYQRYRLHNQRQHVILDYIEEHYNEDLSLQHLSQVCHMSQEHFSRAFHEYFNMNFKRYLTNYRIFKSYDDIVHSSMCMQEIAFAHGFSSTKAFIKAFKDRYQDTPYHYRSLHQTSKKGN